MKNDWEDGDVVHGSDMNAVANAVDGKQDVLGFTPENTANKGAANGYASLDAGGKIPAAQLPNSVMEYQGTWNVSTNTPALSDGVGNAGDVYRVSVGGSRDLGSGSVSYVSGDYVIYSGSVWEKADTTDAVSSVAGKTGAVTLVKGDVGLGNVDNTSDATKNAANATLTNKTISGSSNTLSNISADSTVDGTSNKVFTAAEKTKLAGIASGAEVNTVNSLGDLGVTASASELNLLDGVTATTAELNHTDGVTSNIQTQLNARVPTSRTVSAGNGLSGGGNLSQDRSFAVVYGTAANTACAGNDPRLADSRTPTAHTHNASDINAGTLSSARMPAGYRAVHVGTSPPGDTTSIWIDTS